MILEQVMRVAVDGRGVDDDSLTDEDVECPPSPVDLEDVCNAHQWLLEEAGEALGAAVDACRGHPHLPTETEAKSPPLKDHAWPPQKAWRLVEVHEEKQPSGGWDVCSTNCDCGRKAGTGRDCAHTFRSVVVLHVNEGVTWW